MATLDDIFAWLESIWDFVVNLPSYLSQMVSAIIHALFYPFEVLFNIIVAWLSKITSTGTNFIGSLFDLGNSVYSLIYSVLSPVLPEEVVQVILALVIILVCLRVYFFIRGER